MKNFSFTPINGGYYCVLKGETLSDIENKFITTKNLVIKENFLTRELKEGDVIFITPHSKSYVVKIDDTPESIARALGTPFEEIVRLNKITYVYPFMHLIV